MISFSYEQRRVGFTPVSYMYTLPLFSVYYFSALFFVVVVLSFLFFFKSTPVSVAAPSVTSCDENVFLEQLQQSGVRHFRR